MLHIIDLLLYCCSISYWFTVCTSHEHRVDSILKRPFVIVFRATLVHLGCCCCPRIMIKCEKVSSGIYFSSAKKMNSHPIMILVSLRMR